MAQRGKGKLEAPFKSIHEATLHTVYGSLRLRKYAKVLNILRKDLHQIYNKGYLEAGAEPEVKVINYHFSRGVLFLLLISKRIYNINSGQSG